MEPAFLVTGPLLVRCGSHRLGILPLRRRAAGNFRAATLAVVRGTSRTRSVRPVVTGRPQPVTRVSSPPWIQLPLSRELDYLLNHPVGELTITGLVVLSCLGFALQTVDLGTEVLNGAPRYIERGISSLFTAEYFLRWYGRNLNPRFLLTRSMLIDFSAIVPLFVDLAAQSSNSVFVRILRLTRIFRLQRMMEEDAQDMFGSMTPAQIRIANVVLTVFSIIYVSAGLFFDAEVDVNPEVNSFFDAFYFATITLFTVGFGDVTPLTPMGRLTTVLTVITGAVLIPFQLTEVERARKSAADARARENGKNPSVLPPALAEFVPFDFQTECKRCHLRGHQLDARFCRNCGLLISKRRFDGNPL